METTPATAARQGKGGRPKHWPFRVALPDLHALLLRKPKGQVLLGAYVAEAVRWNA